MIDIQTFLLALGIGNVGFAVLMAVYMQGAAPAPGLRLWMGARMGMGLTQLLGWLRPQVGAMVELEVIGWIASVALEVAAYCTFLGLVRWQRKLVPLTVLSLALVLAARAGGASVVELTALVSVLVSLFAGVAAAILLRPRPGASLLQKLIGANDAMFAVALSWWAWVGLAQGDIQGFQAGPVQAGAYLAGYLLMIVNGFGFLLLCKQRDDREMVRLATTDSLTGLANRRAFFERADSARSSALRLRQPISLMMIDIDHFKQLNDRFGHASGDAALRVFARTAHRSLREHDVMGRLGGEEFALLLPGTDLGAAREFGERLRAAVSEAPVITSGSGYAMTVSIGLVLVEPNEELAAALARADDALYAAKSGGRDRVEIGELQLRRA